MQLALAKETKVRQVRRGYSIAEAVKKLDPSEKIEFPAELEMHYPTFIAHVPGNMMRPTRLVVGFADFSKDQEKGTGALSVWDAASSHGRFKHKFLIAIEQAPYCFHLNSALGLLVIGMNGLIQIVDSTYFETEGTIAVPALVNCVIATPSSESTVLAGMANGNVCLLNCETHSLERSITLEIPTRLLFG